MKPLVPLESWEQERLVDWLDDNSYRFTSIPNSTFTRSWAIKARNKRQGLRAGLPDLLICLKSQPKILFIEMKRVRPARSVLSPEQKSWIEALTTCGAHATVCYGHEEAIRKIQELET